MDSKGTVSDTGFASPSASWFKPAITLAEIPKPALDLFVRRTGLAVDEVVSHINEARDKAWKAAPYPCVGLFLFLELKMSNHPLYPTILSRLSNTETPCRLVDVGCGLGQDVRKLLLDGVPAGRIYAVELEQGLIDAGLDLFMDAGCGEISFLQGDGVKDEHRRWMHKFDVNDGFDIVHTGALFHLFSWEKQLIIAKHLVELVRNIQDPVIFGWQFAAHKAGLHSLGPSNEAHIYGHNEDSMQRFWKEVGENTGTRWSLEINCEWAGQTITAGLAKEGKWGDGEGNGMMWFSAHRM